MVTGAVVLILKPIVALTMLIVALVDINATWFINNVFKNLDKRDLA